MKRITHLFATLLALATAALMSLACQSEQEQANRLGFTGQGILGPMPYILYMHGDSLLKCGSDELSIIDLFAEPDIDSAFNAFKARKFHAGSNFGESTDEAHLSNGSVMYKCMLTYFNVPFKHMPDNATLLMCDSLGTPVYHYDSNTTPAAPSPDENVYLMLNILPDTYHYDDLEHRRASLMAKCLLLDRARSMYFYTDGKWHPNPDSIDIHIKELTAEVYNDWHKEVSDCGGKDGAADGSGTDKGSSKSGNDATSQPQKEPETPVGGCIFDEIPEMYKRQVKWNLAHEYFAGDRAAELNKLISDDEAQTVIDRIIGKRIHTIDNEHLTSGEAYMMRINFWSEKKGGRNMWQPFIAVPLKEGVERSSVMVELCDKDGATIMRMPPLPSVMKRYCIDGHAVVSYGFTPIANTKNDLTVAENMKRAVQVRIVRK